MTALTEVATSRPATPPASGLVLSQSDVLSTASSIIQSYPSITSAYLFGSYAKGTPRPDSDIDIALFIPDLCWDKLADIGGVQMDLEGALDRQVDLSVCPPDDFVERIKRYWVPINLHCGKPGTYQSDSPSSSGSTQAQVSPGLSGIASISQYSPSTTTIGGLTLTSIPQPESSSSPPSPTTPMVIAEEVALKITGQTTNGLSLSKKEPE